MECAAKAHAKNDDRTLHACGVGNKPGDYEKWCVEMVEFIAKLRNAMETGVEEL